MENKMYDLRSLNDVHALLYFVYDDMRFNDNLCSFIGALL